MKPSVQTALNILLGELERSYPTPIDVRFRQLLGIPCAREFNCEHVIACIDLAAAIGQLIANGYFDGFSTETPSINVYPSVALTPQSIKMLASNRDITTLVTRMLSARHIQE